MKQAYEKHFLPYAIKYGRITTGLTLLFLFLPCFVMYILNIVPSWNAVLLSCITVLSGGFIYFIIEPISYFPTLGVAGTYMSCVTGESSNLKMPCAVIAQDAAGVTPGTQEGDVISTLGVAVSSLVNFLMVLIATIGGTALLSILPESITGALNYLLPALFGSMIANIIIANPKRALSVVPMAVVITVLYHVGAYDFLPATLRSAVALLGCAFIPMIVHVIFAKKQEKKQPADPAE